MIRIVQDYCINFCWFSISIKMKYVIICIYSKIYVVNFINYLYFKNKFDIFIIFVAN